jgi:hypothetical protein
VSRLTEADLLSRLRSAQVQVLVFLFFRLRVVIKSLLILQLLQMQQAVIGMLQFLQVGKQVMP